MNILGISCFFHDAAAALLVDGQLVAAAEEERFTRKKHDFGFPMNAIRFCMKKARLEGNDLDYVVFFEKPVVKFDRILMTALQTFPGSWRVFREAMVSWLGDKLWVRNTIHRMVGVPAEKILFSEHHLSHAASSFFCSPFEDSAILTVDGVGEWTTASLGVGQGNDLRILREMRFPHSLGLFYSAFTAFLGFEVNEGEYKVMGMAPYGKPRYVDDVRRLIRICDDGSFWLDMDYFSFHYSTDTTFSARFVQLFGKPRDPKLPFFSTEVPGPGADREGLSGSAVLGRENQYYADVAASVQAVTEDVLLAMARTLHRETGLRKLCLAGGVALNSVANGRILRETPFEEIYVQPSAGDGGGALGAALFAYHVLLGRPRSFTMDHAFWGQDYSATEVQDFLTDNSIRYERLEDEEQLLDRIVDDLTQGKVAGWFDGRFEWGPRALGHRSILADPRKPEMKDVVNTKIKFREPFRPFAPSVLAEHVGSYFDLQQPARHYPARFMLLVVNVKSDKRHLVPATTHVDGSGRVQVVFPESNGRFHHLIERFYQATGVPVLLNTSFNLRSEPMVNSPKEAFATFSRSGLDLLVMDQFVIRKR